MRSPRFPVEGGCQCRAVRYRITAPPLAVYNCDCKDCRRSSGGTHTMSMPTRREHVELRQGELVAFDKAADSGRVVRMLGCARCGTKVWNEPLSYMTILTVKPGTLDDLSWAAGRAGRPSRRLKSCRWRRRPSPDRWRPASTIGRVICQFSLGEVIEDGSDFWSLSLFRKYPRKRRFAQLTPTSQVDTERHSLRFVLAAAMRTELPFSKSPKTGIAIFKQRKSSL
jgi:hypothetical protein